MAIHPSDGRYKVDDLEPYFSDDSLLKYIVKIELAHLGALVKRGICSQHVYNTIAERALQVTAKMWNEKQKEPKYKHNIRALIALINEPLPADMKRFFHIALTSYDGVDNANVLGLKDATYEVVLPSMISLGNTLLGIANTYKSDIQVGRSHGQHGEPTTFGREMAWHADRLGNAVVRVKTAADEFRGKIAGAMGTKSSLMLLGDADELEEEVLGSVGLKPARIATQILQPEDSSNYYSQIVIAFGVLNNLSNDMRHLTRTEIGEIALELPEGHGRSSAMPHKGLSEQGVVIGNPEDFENICGQYRSAMPSIISVFLNQECEHNRDLRNSSAERYYKPQILSPFVYSTRRCDEVMKKVRPNKDVMHKRVENAWNLLMEPAYIALALGGETNAQDYVRNTIKQYGDFKTALQKDEKLQHAVASFPSIFKSPDGYVGSSEKQVDDVVSYWSEKFSEIAESLR